MPLLHKRRRATVSLPAPPPDSDSEQEENESVGVSDTSDTNDVMDLMVPEVVIEEKANNLSDSSAQRLAYIRKCKTLDEVFAAFPEYMTNEDLVRAYRLPSGHLAAAHL